MSIPLFALFVWTIAGQQCLAGVLAMDTPGAVTGGRGRWHGSRYEIGMNEKLTGGVVTVCCACYPGNTIFDTYPEWKGLGLQVSHGICNHHLRLLYPQEYLAMKNPLWLATVTGTGNA